jgi:uncharacterized membrane protein
MFYLRQVARYFVRGCLALAPIALTAYIVYLIFKFADELLPFSTPGLGILAAVVVITLVGFLTSNVVGNGILELADRMLTRVPLVKLIYASLKDLISAFTDRKRFNQPVSVALTPDEAIRTLGFITRKTMEVINLPQHVAVYLPQSYNFAGNVIIVPRNRVQLLDASNSDVMTFIVSGGVSGLIGGKAPAPAGMAAPTPSPAK